MIDEKSGNEYCGEWHLNKDRFWTASLPQLKIRRENICITCVSRFLGLCFQNLQIELIGESKAHFRMNPVCSVSEGGVTSFVDTKSMWWKGNDKQRLECSNHLHNNQNVSKRFLDIKKADIIYPPPKKKKPNPTTTNNQKTPTDDNKIMTSLYRNPRCGNPWLSKINVPTC